METSVHTEEDLPTAARGVIIDDQGTEIGAPPGPVVKPLYRRVGVVATLLGVAAALLSVATVALAMAAAAPGGAGSVQRNGLPDGAPAPVVTEAAAVPQLPDPPLPAPSGTQTRALAAIGCTYGADVTARLTFTVRSRGRNDIASLGGWQMSSLYLQGALNDVMDQIAYESPSDFAPGHGKQLARDVRTDLGLVGPGRAMMGDLNVQKVTIVRSSGPDGTRAGYPGCLR